MSEGLFAEVYLGFDSQLFFQCCLTRGMDLEYIMNNMLHISILGGEQVFFTFINRAAVFQYFGGPRLFRDLFLRSSQCRFLPVIGLALLS